MKKKWIRYIAWFFIIVIAGWFLLLVIAYGYIQLNKKQLIASVKADISKKIDGKLDFDNFSVDLIHNFPGVSLDMKNVHITDTAFNTHKKELIQLKHVYMGFGMIELLTGKKSPKYINLSEGKIYMFKDTLGNRNWEILKTTNSSPGKSISVKRLTLKNVGFYFEDNEKFKFHYIWFEKGQLGIDDKGDRIEFELDNKAIIKQAAFNTLKGGYLSNKRWTGEIKFNYDKGSKRLSFTRQNIKLDKQTYQLTGNFYLETAHRHFDLAIKTPDISLKEIASLFPPVTASKLEQIGVSKKIKKVEATLSGPMRFRENPLVTVLFKIENATIQAGAAKFEQCSFTGSFKDQFNSEKSPSDTNAYIQLSDVKGKWETNAFDSKSIIIANLIEPYIRGDFHTSFEVSQLEKLIGSSKIDFNSGKADARLNYSGPLSKSMNMVHELDGVIKINNADITYRPRNLHFEKTNIDLTFDKGDLVVKKWNTFVNGNEIRTSGNVKGFLTFFNTDPSKAVFDWNVYSPKIDIGKLKASLRRKSAAKNKTSDNTFAGLNNKLDKLFDECNAFVKIEADKLIYKNFVANNVHGSLQLANDMVRLQNFSLSHAGGFVSLNASSKDNGNSSTLVLQSKLQNVDVKELFASFNNFGMQTLTSKNIDGKFSATIDLTTMLDANDDLYKPANRGYVDFSLKNGSLVDFKPLMEIDNNFLKKRNLQHINFAELKNKLELNGNEVLINRMEIQTTAVSMFVEGIYSFTNTTDLSIQVPLKGLKKKNEDFTPENKGVDAKTGMSIFLRAKDDKDGKIKFAYEPFGRFRKKEKGDKAENR